MNDLVQSLGCTKPNLGQQAVAQLLKRKIGFRSPSTDDVLTMLSKSQCTCLPYVSGKLLPTFGEFMYQF